MRTLFKAVLWLAVALAGAAHAQDYRAPGRERSVLTIYSTLDTAVFEPLVKDFQALHPQIGIRYELLDAMPQYQRFVRESDSGRPRADLLLSTAMDLQVKLVNDGYAAPHISENSQSLPAWARWRDEAFGFTFEPAVMVFNQHAFGKRKMPRSRAELLDAIRSDPAFWDGKIGTYDISRSSVGYLLASQDIRQSSEFGALVEALADVHTQVEENTSTLLDQVASGELVAGYNLLGSYARARSLAGSPLVLVYPSDHTLVVSRTALIARDAPNPTAAHLFLEYLLSVRGQQVLSTRSGLPPIRQEGGGLYGQLGVHATQVGLLRPIALGPGLLVYLDKQKRQRLLSIWRGILDAPPP